MKTSPAMRLLSHNPLDGFGNVGEGMALQLTRDRRRVLWLAHESAPKNVTAVDVSNPKKPSVIVQTTLPHDKMRSNSLDLVGDLLVVAYQTREPGMTPAGFEIFDVAAARSRALVAAGDAGRRHRAGTAAPPHDRHRVPRAQHQRLSAPSRPRLRR